MWKRLLFLVLFAASLPAHAGRLLDLQIVNQTTGETLDLHRHRGQLWVAGEPGDRYALGLVNHTGQRILVVLSVDGINVINGETAAPDQTGYVLGPWERAEIAGWRKSLSDVARFYFTALPDSYAARTDRPDNVGVIGAAVFLERPAPPPVTTRPYQESQAMDGAAPAPSASAAAPAPLAKATRQAERLGTGHGERIHAPTRYTDFQRASERPAEVLSVRYDSRENLAVRGILPRPLPQGPEPRPFPGSFVPDPRG